jgi:hypothetical protein
VFLVCVAIWELAVALLYGFLLGYAQSLFTNMQSISTDSYYYASDSTSTITFIINSVQFPFPNMVAAIAITLLIVGNSV